MREFRAKRPTAAEENEALFIFEFVRLSRATQDSLVAFCRGELFVLVAVRAVHPRARCSRGAWTKPSEGARFVGEFGTAPDRASTTSRDLRIRHEGPSSEALWRIGPAFPLPADSSAHCFRNVFNAPAQAMT